MNKDLLELSSDLKIGVERKTIFTTSSSSAVNSFAQKYPCAILIHPELIETTQSQVTLKLVT